MDRSESIINLSKAMLKAQRKVENAVKDSNNPFFKSKYAGLPEVIEACKSAFNEEGIVITQMVQSLPEGDFLETIFIHGDSGEFLASKMKLQGVQAGMQAFGSAVSYGRRYALSAMAFVSTVDDDGEAAEGRKPTPPVNKHLGSKFEASQSTSEIGQGFRKKGGI